VPPKPKPKKKNPAVPLDDALRSLLHAYAPDPAALLALGKPALDRLLDAPDGVFFPDFMDWRDWGTNRRLAVAAFAKEDMGGVLAAMRKRKWDDAQVVHAGVGLVRDVRVVPFLVRAASAGEPLTRKDAVDYLALQEHPSATECVLGALTDRSSDVRLAAIRALGIIGDAQAIEPLRDMAERTTSKFIKDEVHAAIASIESSK
jgi:hypothetical protein